MRAKMTFGSVQIEADGDAKEVFAELASAAEVFGQTQCGACGSELVTPVCREVDGNTYYEMKCGSCGCCLAFGQRRADGKLFPRRKKDENWLPNKGWVDIRQKAQHSLPSSEPF